MNRETLIEFGIFLDDDNNLLGEKYIESRADEFLLKQKGKISDKDYNEYCLLWSVYRFLIDTCQKTGWELDTFVTAYGLDSEEAKWVAKKENVQLENA